MEMTKPPAPRPQDELEAALLPPAIAPPNNISNINNTSSQLPTASIAVTAIPVEYFQYPTTTATTDACQTTLPTANEITTPLVTATATTTTTPLAPNLPHATPPCSSNPHTHSQIARDQIALANAVGQITQEEMSEKDRQAKNQIYAANYFEQRRVESANDAARRRDKEGLEVTEDRWFRGTGDAREVSDEMEGDVVEYKAEGGGYKVQEYDVKEYSGYEYDTTYEYKSVYD